MMGKKIEEVERIMVYSNETLVMVLDVEIYQVGGIQSSMRVEMTIEEINRQKTEAEYNDRKFIYGPT